MKLLGRPLCVSASLIAGAGICFLIASRKFSWKLALIFFPVSLVITVVLATGGSRLQGGRSF